MTNSVEFKEYDNAPNYPTWVVGVEINNEQEAQHLYRKYADEGGIYAHIAPKIKHAFENGIGDSSIYAGIVKSWLTNSVGRIEWSQVYDMLRQRKPKREPDGFTMLMYNLMRNAPWQDIVKEAEFDIDADRMLREWMDIQMYMWIENSSARRNKTPFSEFCRVSFDLYFAMVDWDYINNNLSANAAEEANYMEGE